MRDKFLLLLTVTAACLCAIFILFVVDQSSQTRLSLSSFGVGVFNNTNQASLNLMRFRGVLEDFRAQQDPKKKQEAHRLVIRQYDILWGAFIGIRQYKIDNNYEEIRELIDISSTFVRNIEPDMANAAALSDVRISEILDELQELFELNYQAANNHFIRHSKLSDDVSSRIKTLHKTYLILGPLLFLAVASFLLLLYKAHKRQTASTKQLQTAHEQLTRVVDELRSGNLERIAQNRFFAAASHDLRQPLHALGLFLNSLEKKVRDPEGMQLFSKIRQSTTALNSLFNSMLDISRLDAGVVQVDQEHFSIAVFLDEIMGEFTASAKEQGVTVWLASGDDVVYCDKTLLSRIIRNLVRNVFTHAPDSNLFISTSRAVAGDTVSLLVRDDGPGIAIKEHEFVFSEYYQLNNPDRDRNKGLGLGLSIVKRLAGLLNIEFDFTSKPSEGTAFTLHLIAGDAESVIPIEQKASASDLENNRFGGLCVLVIEDEKDIREGMEIILRAADCVVMSGECADTAKESAVLGNCVPQLIITDYRLRGGQTGSDVVELVREEFNQDIPALIITGDTSPLRVSEASESGLYLLHKPVVPDELFTMMRRIVAERSIGGSLPGSKLRL